MSHPAGIPTPRVDFAARPMLVFWEITRSCLLACRHCRASATAAPLPGELSHQEGMDMIDQVAGFGRPYPILVLTGGDCLLRDDVFELVAHATELGVPVCLSPSVTPMLTPESIARMASSGVKAVSLSLDGSCPGDARRHPRHPGSLRGDPARHQGHQGRRHQAADQHHGDERQRARDARRREDRQGLRRRHVGGLLPRARGPGRGHRCHQPAGARGRLPLPLRRLAPRLRRAHRRGPVLPPGRARAPRGRTHPGQPSLRRAVRSARRAGGGGRHRARPTPPPPATARASCSSPTTARSTRPASPARPGLGARPAARRHLPRPPHPEGHPCRRVHRPVRARASTPTCAAGRAPGPTPRPGTRSARHSACIHEPRALETAESA